MANKYKDESTCKIDAKEGSINLTYGVDFLNNPGDGRYVHRQYRPYLVLCKTESQKFLAVKLSTKHAGYMSEFGISAKKYGYNEVMPHDSYADMRFIYELEDTDFTKEGFSIDAKDYDAIIGKIMNLYCIGETQITRQQALEIFKKYLLTRSVKVGSVIKTDYDPNYLIVLSMDEEGYTCLPLHRNDFAGRDEIINIIPHHPSYASYDEEIKVSREDVFSIVRFFTENKLMQHILEQKNSHNNRNKKLDI